MKKPREIAEKLVEDFCNCDSESCCAACKRDNINLLTVALESYGRECRLQALDDAAAVIELYMRVDKYASQPEQRGLLVNAPGLIRALKEKP